MKGFRNLFGKKSPNNFDINVELEKLREMNVKVTFRDIKRDYQNYRMAYFFHQVVPTPTELNNQFLEKEPVPDLTNYSTIDTLKWVYKHRESHNTFSV
jgi:hypothetical protein